MEGGEESKSNGFIKKNLSQSQLQKLNELSETWNKHMHYLQTKFKINMRSNQKDEKGDQVEVFKTTR